MHKFRRPDSERISMDELSKIYELKDGYLSRKHGVPGRGNSRKKLGRVSTTGYLWTSIRRENGKREWYSVHSLTFFLDHGYWALEIDHDDRNKLNNHTSNLKDRSHKENQQDLAKPVMRSDGKRFDSLGDAAEAHGRKRWNTDCISKTCKGMRKSAYGFRWEYA